MKVYYFTIIAVGLMFLLYLGGVDTNSSQIINAIGGDDISGFSTATLWITLAAALAGFVATNRISIGTLSFQASTESVIAGFMAAIYVIFAADLFSIVSKVGSLTCPVGATIASCRWEYWIVWAIIVPLLVGYAISIVSYIRGSD